MRRMIMAAAALALVAAPAAAQGGGAAGRGAPGVRAPMLRAQVEDAFLRRARQELGLTDDQVARIAKVLEASGQRRAALDETERAARMALSAQLRPGIAANSDSVGRLVESITANRVAHAESFRVEMRELSEILSPVQRGQFMLMRDRMLTQVRAARNPPPAVIRRPGMR